MMKEVVIKEVLKWLNADFIYEISDSPWMSPVHVVPKKGGFTVIRNEKNELIPNKNCDRMESVYILQKTKHCYQK